MNNVTVLVVKFEIRLISPYLPLIPIGKNILIKGIAHRITMIFRGIFLMSRNTDKNTPVMDAAILMLKSQ